MHCGHCSEADEESVVTMPEDTNQSSVFDSILNSVRAGIDAWQGGGAGGADVGGSSGAQGQTTKSAATGGGTDLIFLLLIGVVLFVVID